LPHSQVPAPRGNFERFVTCQFVGCGVVSTSYKPPSFTIVPCRLSATAYSIYSQLLHVGGRFYPQTEEAPFLGDRGPTYLGVKANTFLSFFTFFITYVFFVPNPRSCFVFCHLFLCQYLPTHHVCCCSQSVRDNTVLCGLVESAAERNLGATSRRQRKCS
jgi:hypothetical protein